MVEFDVSGDFESQSEELNANGIKIKIEYLLVGTNKYAVVNRIEARGRGDQALEMLTAHLQKRANERNVTIVHVGIPTNKASWSLFHRHSEYNLDSGRPIRIFNPQITEK